MILPDCSRSSSSILGANYLCPSTNTCIPYFLHCSGENYRCPTRSDDLWWCEGKHRLSNCSDPSDSVCFDGRCIKGGRCDLMFADCPCSEDEYMCDQPSPSNLHLPVPYRQVKQFSQGRRSNILRFSLYPLDAKINKLDFSSPSISTPFVPPTLSSPVSSYMCNRGLGLLNPATGLVVCFCPPQYFGEKCQCQPDRVSVVLHLDLSQSIEFPSERTDRALLLKLVVHFLFNDVQVLMSDHFHLHPSVQIDLLLNDNQKKTKFISHFLFPRSSAFLQQ